MNEKVEPEVVENRRRWVEALESGGYQQTTGQLREGDAFCCLGVACDLLDIGEWDENRYLLDKSNVPGITVMPTAVRPHFGLEFLSDLMCRNDGTGPPPPASEERRSWTFPEIAALLRSDDWFGPDLDNVLAGS